MLVQGFLDQLRPLVGSKSWDYIVLWKLSDDHRSLEWLDCCCAGIENMSNGGEELLFPSAHNILCKDVLFQHPRSKACDLLDQLPYSLTLESGIHARAVLSNEAKWLNFSSISELNVSEEAIGTRVFIPVSLGLIELLVTKQVPEDHQVIDFVRAQCNIFLERQGLNDSGATESGFSVDMNGIHEIPSQTFAGDENISRSIFQSQISPDTSKENSELPNDISIDRLHLITPAINSLPQMPSISETGNNNNLYFEENNRLEIDSDPNDEEEEMKCSRRRTGKGPQSKNLVAERKRRKKLNDRLYHLRALVPNITKLDRAAILGDAIDYVKELQREVKELQLELEENSDDENARKVGTTDSNNQAGVLQQNGIKRGLQHDPERFSNGFQKGPSEKNSLHVSKQNNDPEKSNEPGQQMEPQVEVHQLDQNEFFVKVFCEHKSGGFVRLTEALNALHLEVTNVNTTRHTCLVSNVFKVEKRDSEMLQADHVRDSLLEITRNPSRGWAEIVRPDNGNTSIDYEHQQHQLYHNHNHHSLPHSHQMNSHHFPNL